MPAIRLEKLVHDLILLWIWTHWLLFFIFKFNVDVTIADGASSGWELAEYIPTYTPQFNTVQKGGFVTGGAAKGIMSGSGLPTASML